MKVFIFRKKSILIILAILILVICFIPKNNFTLALSLSNSEVLNSPFKDKFNSLYKSNEKNVYLTFDDGPTSKVTPKILDILKKENVKATFFVVGKHVKEHPEIVKQAYEEGHFIANHGYSHNNSLLYKSEESFRNEILNTDEEISKAIGVSNYCSHVFRFPNGFASPDYKYKKKNIVNILAEINYVYVDWNCLNKDSEHKYSNYQLLNNLKKSAKGKGTLVVLMHDTGDVNKTYDILQDSIEYLKAQGYIFKNFYELFTEAL